MTCWLTGLGLVKASDYCGPGAGAQSNVGDRVFGPAPDIGRRLAELGSRDGVTGEVWHVPNDPDTRTTREPGTPLEAALDAASSSAWPAAVNCAGPVGPEATISPAAVSRGDRSRR